MMADVLFLEGEDALSYPSVVHLSPLLLEGFLITLSYLERFQEGFKVNESFPVQVEMSEKRKSSKLPFL